MTGLWRLDQRSHVQGGRGPSARHRPQTVRLPRMDMPAVPVEGSHSHQGGDLAPQFRVPNSGGGTSRVRESCSPTPGTVREQVVPNAPLSSHTGLWQESLPQPMVKIVQLLFQPGDVGLDAGTNGADVHGTQAVLLRDQHGHHLVSAGGQRVPEGTGSQHPSEVAPTAERRRRSGPGPPRPERRSILASVPVCPGKVPDLTGVDPRLRASSAAARAAKRHAPRPARAAPNTTRAGLTLVEHLGDKLPDSPLIVGDRPLLPRRADSDIHLGLCHINACVHLGACSIDTSCVK